MVTLALQFLKLPRSVNVAAGGPWRQPVRPAQTNINMSLTFGISLFFPVHHTIQTIYKAQLFLHFSKGQMVSTHIFFLRFPTHSMLKAQFVKIFSEGNDFNTHLLSTVSKGHDLNAHVLSRFYIFHSNWFQSTSSILDCSRKLMFKVQSMFSTCSKGLYFQNTCVSIFSKELDFNAYLLSIFSKGIDFESSSSILYIFQKKWFQHTSSFYIFPKEIIFNVHLLSTISKAFNVQST